MSRATITMVTYLYGETRGHCIQILLQRCLQVLIYNVCKNKNTHVKQHPLQVRTELQLLLGLHAIRNKGDKK